MLDTNYKTLSTSVVANETETGTRWLVQIHPLNLEQNRYALGLDSLTIGRSVECDIVLEDSSVSRQHALIRYDGSRHTIADLGSTNRVRVNDRFVEHSDLRSGDRIQLGDWIFRYLADNDVESQYHETVYDMMTRDALTNAFNKRYLLECLDREIARAIRHQGSLSMILIDIDHFKSINDTHGHMVGDEVLRELATRISGILRKDEIFARFGGEEFAIVIGFSEKHDAIALAERCRTVVADEKFSSSAGELEITISLGVESMVPHADLRREEILEAADKRLYQAKEGGRNRVCH